MEDYRRHVGGRVVNEDAYMVLYFDVEGCVVNDDAYGFMYFDSFCFLRLIH
jgi:hypothetical protein